MSLEQVILMPHPPIALPEVAGPRFKDVEKTANAMFKLSQDIIKLNPELIIIITPHSNIQPASFATFSVEDLQGDFSMFGAPQVKIDMFNDLNFINKLKEIRNKSGLNDIHLMKKGVKLDHGSGVPLYYLNKAGYCGTVAVFNYSFASIVKHLDFGKSLVEAIKQTNNKAVLLASGDLSHRVIPTAPAGFHPDGEKFDKFIVDSIETGNYDQIINIDQSFRENAGECVYNSLMVAFGALNKTTMNNKIYSYEAPFGVGYLVASL
jgi:MEMO1 family protein